MQKLQRIQQHGLKDIQRSVLAYRIVGIIQSGLHHLDVPVAELIPDKIVHLLYGDTKLEVLHIVGHFFDQDIAL